MTAAYRYQDTIEELKRRIEALLPTNPKILMLNNPMELHQVPGFECDDLSPRLAQIAVALDLAKNEARHKPACPTL